jgi:anionic cell wall polymer biosynthesis LytR-Cps2A-Psr (LCP) family protein
MNGAHHLGAVWHPHDPDAGISLQRTTLERAFLLQIQEHVVVDFEGFRRAVDVLGGIEVDVPHRIEDSSTGDYWNGARFPPGPQRLTGERALRYVRTRKADSDTARRRRQLDVLVALHRTALSGRSFTNLVQLALADPPLIRTSLSLADSVALLAAERARARQPAVEIIAEPLARPVQDAGGHWATEGDVDKIGAVVRSFLGIPSVVGARAEPRPHAGPGTAETVKLGEARGDPLSKTVA